MRLLLFFLICTISVKNALSQPLIKADEARNHVDDAASYSVYGRIYYGKIVAVNGSVGDIDEILYIGSKPLAKDFVILIRRRNFKSDSIQLYNQKVHLTEYETAINLNFSTEYAATGRIFLFEGRPAVRIQSNQLGVLEQTDRNSPAFKLDSLIKNDPNRVYSSTGKEPEFPGGWPGLNDYLKQNLKRPAGPPPVNSKVILSLVIERDGMVKVLTISRKVSPDYDAEAIRVITNGPKWTPGYDKGKPVRVAYTVPVDFSIIN